MPTPFLGPTSFPTPSNFKPSTYPTPSPTVRARGEGEKSEEKKQTEKRGRKKREYGDEIGERKR
eukprot:303360-Amorphochlora_amoeboformis.AAC.1